MISVALTFDDGPNTVTTPQVLDKLEKYDICASFFLVGNNIREDSGAISRRAFNAGCEICSHSRTHSDMTKLTADEIRAEIGFTDEKIAAVAGAKARFFRPPYIAVNDTMLEAVDKVFIAGIGADDWLDEVTAEMRAEKILSNVRDGSIILLHDSEGNSQTVAALDKIIPALLADGYTFHTVSGLFAEKNITPQRGRIYSNVLQTEMY